MLCPSPVDETCQCWKKQPHPIHHSLEGACAFCDSKEIAIDDMGVFEIHPTGRRPGKHGVVCWDCLLNTKVGTPMWWHQEIYGVGER